MALPMTEVLDQLGAPKPDSARKTFIFIKSGVGKTPYSIHRSFQLIIGS